MAHIAKSLGVSVQTVSAVVNGKPGISLHTQERVREAVTRLEYQPNVQARTLRGVKSKTIGVIIPSITNPYFPEFVKGAEDAARALGYSMFLCNTDSELRHLLEYFALIKTNKASGLICSVGISGDWLDDGEVVRWLRQFANDGVSVVLNGKASADLPIASAVVDSDVAIREAVMHLLHLGHRRVALISPPVGLSVTAERVAAYRAAFAEFGHPLAEEMIVPGDFDIAVGAAATRDLMRRRQRPTAIIAANDLAAFGAISALTAMGLSVPDDMSVVGFDDIAFAKVFQPALTTIKQPVYDLGREALRLATTDTREGTAPEVVTLAASFIARQSTGPAR
ncbi:LacI family DNA-binding transcriptional regulator [Devosia algicola]|uniref:LacI family DNA-binding transcriptional regulator n=1 Tax=Devosia algicola TaxID=3026418 RepID=A0ABY7YSR8_9HYPH|nr:LacI family DNA-binding transcriptional regulator [Devosia algicola]WDR04237.1 LacI family DNA-binding transcriptional regulator [Devosia algicola]